MSINIPPRDISPVSSGTVLGRTDAGSGDAQMLTAGSGVMIANGQISASGGGGGAPIDASYITKTPNGFLTNSQALSTLSSGVMRVANATGAVTSLGDPTTVGSALLLLANPSAVTFPRINANNTVTTRTPENVRADLDLEPGTDFLALPTGTPTGSKYLRDDNTWQTAPSGAGDLQAANNLSDLANVATARTNLGLAIGTNVQAYDADLTTWAGITPGSNVGAFLATPSGANLAAALTTALPASKGGTGLTALAANVVSMLGAADNAAIRTAIGLDNYTPHGAVGATQELDATTAWHSLTLDADTTLTIINWATVRTILLEILQDATGSRTITWPAGVLTPPTIDSTPDSVTLVTLSTRDAGMTIYALSTAEAGGGGGDMLAANDLSDLNNIGTARTNLGLGTLATQSGTFSGTSSGTNTGDQTSVTGNAGTATALATARNINGVAFNGTANITVPAAGSTLTDTVPVDKGGTGLTALGTALQTLRVNASATALEYAAPGGGGDALVANPLSQFASTTSAQLAGVLSDETGSGGGFVRATAPTIDAPNITGIATTDGASVTTPYTLPAFVVDVTKGIGQKTISQAETFTFSGTPATAGTWFSLEIANSTGAAVVATIPSSYSMNAGAAITTASVPANGSVHLIWRYTGSGYRVYGDPVAAAAPADGSITLAMMADMATASLIGRNTAGTGVPEVLSASTVRTLLGLVIGTNVQAYDADLTTYAGITPAANTQSLLAAADYAAMRTLLGLVIGTNVQAYDADLTTYAGITPSANTQSLLGAADYAAMRTLLGLVIGTNVQAYDADLTTWAGITPAANVATFLATPSGANLAAALTTALPVDKGGTGLTAVGSALQVLRTNAGATAFEHATITRTGVVREISVGAGGMTPSAVNGAATGSYAPAGADAATIDVFDFDDTTSESVQFVIAMPTAWNLGTIKAKFYWTSISGTGTVIWSIAAGAASDDDALGAILGTAVTVTDTLLASADAHISPATAAITVGGTPALDDLVLFKVLRDISDTKTGDARLIAVKLQYTESTTEPSAW